MARTFRPCRLVITFVLSVMLILSVTHLTQAKSSYLTQIYPSQMQVEKAISYYYASLSIFRKKNAIKHFDSLTYRPIYSVLKPWYNNPEDQKKFDGFAEWWRFDVCAQYQFAPVALPAARQTARHLFTFEMTHDTWSVIGMGLQSC